MSHEEDIPCLLQRFQTQVVSNTPPTYIIAIGDQDTIFETKLKMTCRYKRQITTQGHTHKCDKKRQSLSAEL